MAAEPPRATASLKTLYERRLLTLLMAVAAAAPLFWLVKMVIANYVGTPFADTWSVYYRVAKFMNGDSTFFGFILPQYNEARPVVPRLILYLVHSLNRSLAIDVVLDIASAMGAAGATLWLLRKTNPKLSWLSALAVGVLFSLNFFSIAQWENWNWHTQLMMFLPNLFFAIGWLINFSSLPPVRRGLLVSGCCVLSTFSFANGLFQWFLLIPIAAGLERKTKIRLWALHLGMALLSLFLYFWGYKSPAEHQLGEGLSHPIRVATYLFAWLGSSLSGGSLFLAEILGGIMLLTFLLLGSLSLWGRWRQNLRIACLPWLSMGGYALISGAAAAVGRSHIGLAQALQSRYCTISLWIVVACIGLGVTFLQQSTCDNLVRNRLGVNLFALLAAAFFLFAGRHEVRAAEAWLEFAESMHFQEQSFGLEQAKPGQLWTLEHPNRHYVKDSYAVMRKAGFLRDFYRSAQILPLLAADRREGAAEGELEFAVELPSQRVLCKGWSAGGNREAGNRVLIVVLKSTKPTVLAVADGPIDRRLPGVGVRGKPALTKRAGFELEFQMPKLEPPGTCRVAAFRYGKGEQSYALISTPKELIIVK
jgi:hypothetical protein